MKLASLHNTKHNSREINKVLQQPNYILTFLCIESYIAGNIMKFVYLIFLIPRKGCNK